MTDIDTNPLLLSTAGCYYAACVSSQLWSPVLLQAAANRPFVRKVISRQIFTEPDLIRHSLACTWSNLHVADVPLYHSAFETYDMDSTNTKSFCGCSVTAKAVRMSLRNAACSLLWDGDWCAALYHIVVWNRGSDFAPSCPPAYHTQLPSEASSLRSNVQKPYCGFPEIRQGGWEREGGREGERLH